MSVGATTGLEWMGTYHGLTGDRRDACDVLDAIDTIRKIGSDIDSESAAQALWRAFSQRIGESIGNQFESSREAIRRYGSSAK